MLFAEDDAPLLKTWIIKRLANTSDADADVLADYVLALLRHEGDDSSIRKLFEEEIPDFLRDDSTAFIEDIFQAIKYKSYLPGAPTAPPVVRKPVLSSQPSKLPTGPAALKQQPPTFPGAQHTPYSETPSAFATGSFRNGSRKRSYRDLDAPDPQSLNWDLYGDPPGRQGAQQPYKQARRGGSLTSRGGRPDDPYAPRGRSGYDAYNAPNGNNPSGLPGGNFGDGTGYNPQQMLPMYQQNSGVPPIDANTILENIQRLQELGAQMGLQMPQSSGQLPKPIYSGPAMSAAPSRRKKRPCRDYERKGFCSRGNKCQYDHGDGSVYVPSFVVPTQSDEYDPNNATMAMALDHPGHPVKPQDRAGFQMPQSNRNDSKKSRRKGARSSLSAEGPVHDKTNTKIVVENIPEANFSEDEIQKFFSQFGDIKDISMRPSANAQKRIALVNFNSWDSANAAWQSPKVVFDNRFVKVYWYKDETQLPHESKKGGGHRNGTANVEKVSSEPDFDMEEFKRKQEGAQKAHLEKTQKREALERERQELEDKRKELVARQQEERRKLQAKLAESGAHDGSLSPILKKANIDGDAAEDGVSQTETLRARLAALEQEANSLGLDPDAPADDSFGWAARGGGRGRRPYRARGSFPPRAYSGGYGYRGRGGGVGPDIHAAYATYSLDNRPKVISLTGVDFTEPSKDEALRQYLFGIGEFTAISTEPTATHVTFKDRKTAEQFMFGVSTNNSIPGVDGTVELSWSNSLPKTANADADTSTANNGEDEQASKQAAEEEVEESGGFDTADVGDQGDMDYEEGEWEIS
ncbi:hypothetical protein BX600DRAFT_504797 [Xylariales sp. PMI_506]|nr:hypothetical protein BX600DRAFT_504797 [Xylariales sp. PMI_506]